MLAGTELNDDPLAPISTQGQRLVDEHGDDAPVEWLPREARYNEKLATPDVSIADLLGDIDPIKAATRKLTFADPEVIHFGIVPRTNRGIFAINELPDLAPRIQVGLLNILEERDLQIRGFPVRIPLDLLLVFSANPEDYTNRGTIITPLKDRISSQILTHYPPDAETAAEITAQEAWTERDGADGGGAARRPPADRGDLDRRPRQRPGRPDLRRLGARGDRRPRAAGVEPRAARAGHRRLAGPPAVWSTSTCCCRRSPARWRWSTRASSRGSRWWPASSSARRSRRSSTAASPRSARRSARGGEDDTGPYAGIVAWFAAGNQVELSDEQTLRRLRGRARRGARPAGARRRASRAARRRRARWPPRSSSRACTSTSSWRARTSTAASRTRRWSSSSSSSRSAAAAAAARRSN